jgi:hypothetical protein
MRVFVERIEISAAGMFVAAATKMNRQFQILRMLFLAKLKTQPANIKNYKA